MANILVVDDEKKMRHLLGMMLSRRNHRVEEAADGMEAFEKIKAESYDMVITDIKMPRLDGMGLLKKIREADSACPVVFITAFATVDSAVEAMREGAIDYITKPFEEERILLTVERTLNFSRIMAENRDLRRELREAAGKDEIVYVSEAMSRIMELASKVAAGETAVLISGESGTGKELLAKYIHKVSPRSGGRFVPVNCAAISANLVESELFGHEKGSFTGADRRSIGKFEYASGGTLFLDEIGDLPSEAQAKLLRTLQEKTVQRVGGNQEIPVDVRIVCATNQNLEALVQEGAFRRDLFFRINVFPLRPPPLRERVEDIAPLGKHFLKRMSEGDPPGFTEGAAKVLRDYRWPGNVRELANAMERACILGGNQAKISVETLSFLKAPLPGEPGEADFQLPAGGLSLEALENDLVRQALEASGNNQSAAAKLLGLTRAKFRVLLKKEFQN